MCSIQDSVNPSMRLKMKADTFYLPEMNGSVYFRNNEGSFQMEGKFILQWVEKLIPVFNGQRSLFELTDGLPELHKKRVYDIANALYQNGFARDVNCDQPHQLSSFALNRYIAQIEFLDNLAGSGAYRFQTYQEAKVLAVGTGSFLASLVSSLFESGISVVTTLDLDSESAKREQLLKIIPQYDAILFVSNNESIDELLHIQSMCRQQKKRFISAIIARGVGIVGPMVHQNAKAGFESVWHRIHSTAFDTAKMGKPSPIAASLLANLIVFELFKAIAGDIDSDSSPQFYFLNSFTLEGAWHLFLPHLVELEFPQTRELDVQTLLRTGRKTAEVDKILMYFGQLTEAYSGIFHKHDEGDLLQLPLAQCYVQVAIPTTEGPAALLPEIICRGLTHEEARCKAGYAGIEKYVMHVIPKVAGSIVHPGEFVGVGTGATVQEAIWRGLFPCLMQELEKAFSTEMLTVKPVQLSSVEDETCAFYLRILNASGAKLEFGMGTPFLGFPVVWVALNGKFVCSTGLNITMAFRTALEQSIAEAYMAPCVNFAERLPEPVAIPSIGTFRSEDVLSAFESLEKIGWHVVVFDLAVEPFLQNVLAGVFGVLLRRVESQ